MPKRHVQISRTLRLASRALPGRGQEESKLLVYVIGDQEDRTEGYPASLTARLNEIDVNVGITGVRLTGTGT